MRTRYVPSHLNPTPRFGLRPLKCRECGDYLEPGDNPIVHLGGGVLAKFGLCPRCLSDEMRWRDEDAYESQGPTSYEMGWGM